MAETKSFYSDGKAYEKLMGRWSRAVGDIFLDWLSLPKGLRWLDIGCGTGAFTEVVLERGAPQEMCAIDPAPDQIAFAQSRPGSKDAAFRIGDAQSLPYADGQFDVAAMALVISFVPDPPKAVAEMKRVVKHGGTVATYVWDLLGKGYVQQPVREALAAMKVDLPSTAGQAYGQIDVLRGLFGNAGLTDVSTRAIEIIVTYENFDEFWSSQTGFNNPTIQPIRRMSAREVELLKAYLFEHLPTDSNGRITYAARANAVKGRVLL